MRTLLEQKDKLVHEQRSRLGSQVRQPNIEERMGDDINGNRQELTGPPVVVNQKQQLVGGSRLSRTEDPDHVESPAKLDPEPPGFAANRPSSNRQTLANLSPELPVV